ncbi:hypothetical protein M2189_001692 [Bradyrhizobium japonicum]|uniref:hypothetical protein n=1 Tax=Bradyrhizobium japonicum TaxID=375 RepID=UPI0021673EB5|nr:hypothetical protein [Bradyrhizobium japonicum]MCS3499347.1 hypothetical protein [Bradyrhizobium japonicum]MCS3958489.1 hypothetical protein [Bradyrhizobium japonicum]MCS4000243.1 hypothetical protein [Bradyrhizobium japonicum]
MSGIAASRDAAIQHSEASAVATRATDARSGAAVHAEASAGIGQGLASMAHARNASMGRAGGHQSATKQRNEQKRQEITEKLNDIQQRARMDIDVILTAMEKEAASQFEAGLKRAIDAFEAERRKLEEQARRERSKEWGRWLGGLGELIGYFANLGSDAVEKAIAGARNAFDRVVSETIDQVAAYVGQQLAAAKARAAAGRVEADAEVAKLPADLQGIGREARAQVEGAFQQLDEAIDSRRDALVDKLSQSYSQARSDMEARAQAFRDDNKSWWDRVKEAVVGFVKAVLAFKDMLLSLLAKAASVIDAILDDPIGFLGNLVAGVKLGLQNFIGNILTHLKAGLMSWLFGALASAGIQMPSSFGVKEIIGLILQVLGLTYANIRARAVRLLGEPMVANLEKAAEMFKVLITEGPAGLWRLLLEKLEAIKEKVLGQVMQMLTVEVFKAGVVWLIGLLNPASAFIKACKAIYDIVMFFIERGRQIIELVNAILDSMAAIAAGNLAKMAAGVESALAKMIPVAIGFLASLLGLGNISEKVKEIIEKIQEPVNQAIDWLIGKAVSFAKAAGQAVAGMFGKKEKGDKPVETADPEHDAKVTAGLADIDTEEQKYLDAHGTISRQSAEQVAAAIRKNHPIFKSVKVVSREGRWDYDYVASAGQKKGAKKGPDMATITAAKVAAYEELVKGTGILVADVTQVKEAVQSGTRKFEAEKDESLVILGAGVHEAVISKEPGLQRNDTLQIEIEGAGTYTVTYFGGTNIFVPAIGRYTEIQAKLADYVQKFRMLAKEQDIIDTIRFPGKNEALRSEIQRRDPEFATFVARFRILREIVEVVRSRTQLANLALGQSTSKGVTTDPMTGSGASGMARREESIRGISDMPKKESDKVPKAGTKVAERYDAFVRTSLDQLAEQASKDPEVNTDDVEKLTKYFVEKIKPLLGAKYGQQ